jgi:hypothetical protein
MSGLSPRYEVEIDLRGETLIYREDGRRATVICTFGPEPWLSPRTLSDWFHPEERRHVPMSAEERAALVERIARHARTRLGLRDLQVEE